MKNSVFAWVSLIALAMTLHASSPIILHASFPDGTGVEIFTETTGSSQIDPVGEMGIGPGVGSQDLVNRVVRDRANNILFVYNLEASRGASPDTVKIRIEPISAASEAGMLKDEASHGRPFHSAHLPTVAGVREFPAVKIGEAVVFDILYNPSNGEKIYDVLRPITSQVTSITVGPSAIPARGQLTAGQGAATPSAIANQPVFEVASVKPARSGSEQRSNFPLGPGEVYIPNGGLFSATGQTLMTYLNFAYTITSDQRPYVLAQLPAWVTTERFDIRARAEGNPGKSEMRMMVRALLADRFKLGVHHETRQVPMVAMVLAKAGKMGPQLRLHSDDIPCANAPSPQSRTIAGDFPSVCNAVFVLPASGPGRIRVGGRNVSIAFIAETVSGRAALGRPLLDKTGITGTVDFFLEWMPERLDSPPLGPSPQLDFPSGPSFQQALREQLGLKLESDKGLLDILVVDHVERPTEN